MQTLDQDPFLLRSCHVNPSAEFCWQVFSVFDQFMQFLFNSCSKSSFLSFMAQNYQFKAYSMYLFMVVVVLVLEDQVAPPAVAEKTIKRRRKPISAVFKSSVLISMFQGSLRSVFVNFMNILRQQCNGNRVIKK
jgi:hypothetical protein